MKRDIFLAIGFVFLLLIISLFIDVDFMLTGFTVVGGDVDVEAGVENIAAREGEVPVIVILKEDKGNFFIKGSEADIEDVKEKLHPLEFEEGHDFKDIGAFSGEITQSALHKLKNDPNVDKIQLDHTFAVALQDSVPLISADKIHEKALLNSLTGKNIGVCVLDTGVNYTHGALVDNYVGGFDFVNSDSDPYDDHGHGTHVSGIVAGIAPNVKLVHNKVLDAAGSGFESSIIAGINWCITNKDIYNIVAISMSFGGGLFSDYCGASFPALTAAISNAIANNITVMASSGNDFSTTQISAPACIQNVIAVGASDKNDALAGYGNRNSILDLIAPGSSINSTAVNGGYATLSGTSMAAPHVAGAVALIEQFEFEESGSFIIPSDVETALKNTGFPIDSWKRIDVYNATVSFDNTMPILTVDLPQQDEIYSAGFVQLNYSAKDVFLSKVVYSLNNGNEVLLNGNTTLNLSGGSYVINVSAYDDNGNIKSIARDFTVDLPSVTLNSPADNENDLDGIVLFNCSASASKGLANISLYHNASGTWHLNSTEFINNITNANVVFTHSFPNNITFGWSCLAYDTDGNVAVGENRTVRINYNTAPTITYYYPNISLVSISEPNNQTFNISSYDAEGDLLAVSWYKSNAIVDNDMRYDFIGSYQSSGAYNISVSVSDGLLNASYLWNLIVNNIEVCGDGIKNVTEGCDGSDFGGLSCTNYGYNSGVLSCSNCAIVANGCSNSTGGSSGGGSGGGDSGAPVTEEEKALLQEALAQREETTGSSDEAVFDESSLFKEEQAIDTAASGSSEEKSQELDVVSQEKKNYRSLIFGVIGGLVVLLIFAYFIRKEWAYIRRNK